MTPEREKRAWVVLGFGTTHSALGAEAFLKDLGVLVTPVPAPKALGSLCGIALRIDPDEASRALELLARAGIRVTGRTKVEDY